MEGETSAKLWRLEISGMNLENGEYFNGHRENRGEKRSVPEQEGLGMRGSRRKTSAGQQHVKSTAETGWRRAGGVGAGQQLR